MIRGRAGVGGWGGGWGAGGGGGGGVRTEGTQEGAVWYYARVKTEKKF